MREEPPLPRPASEDRDAVPSVVGMIAASLAVIVAVGLLGGLLAVGHGDVRAQGGVRGPEEFFQGGVHASTGIEHSWEAMGGAAAKAPESYAWIDRRAGVIQVPIDWAIDLVCAQRRGGIGRAASP